MENLLVWTLTILYSIGGIITFLGFMPTIIDLWQQKQSANILSYVIWTLTTLFTSLYGVFIIRDLIFIVVINLQLLACLVVLILRLRLYYIEGSITKSEKQGKQITEPGPA